MDARGAKILILQHQDDAPAGLLLDAIARAGLQPRTIHLDRGDPLPDPAGWPAAVSLGSSAAADDFTTRWVRREHDWLRAADGAGTAVLGLCFGAQSLSLALGGGLSRNRQRERGWITVRTRDPVLLAPGPWLTWHDDMIHLPPGAELVADSGRGVQAFRAERHLGVQFHPEVTVPILGRWVQDDGGASVDGPTLLEETERRAGAAAGAAARLFDGFLSRIPRE